MYNQIFKLLSFSLVFFLSLILRAETKSPVVTNCSHVYDVVYKFTHSPVEFNSSYQNLVKNIMILNQFKSNNEADMVLTHFIVSYESFRIALREILQLNQNNQTFIQNLVKFSLTASNNVVSLDKGALNNFKNPLVSMKAISLIQFIKKILSNYVRLEYKSLELKNVVFGDPSIRIVFSPQKILIEQCGYSSGYTIQDFGINLNQIFSDYDYVLTNQSSQPQTKSEKQMNAISEVALRNIYSQNIEVETFCLDKTFTKSSVIWKYTPQSRAVKMIKINDKITGQSPL